MCSWPLHRVASRSTRYKRLVRFDLRCALLGALCIYLVVIWKMAAQQSNEIRQSRETILSGWKQKYEQQSHLQEWSNRISLSLSPPPPSHEREQAVANSRNQTVRIRKSEDQAVTLKESGRLLHPSNLKLPTPVIVMGMMKAGTTSIYGYFKCGLDPSVSKISHYDCKPKGGHPEKIGMACGKRMRRNLTKLRKLAFDTMDNFNLYAELDAQELNGGMTLPQWDFTEQIYEHFPNATWILNWREPRKWLRSVDRWQDLRKRFIDNPFLPDLPRGKGEKDSDMLQFYEAQAQRIRDFARAHPSLSFVELPIDSPNAGKILENSFGIREDCWSNRNINTGTAIWTGN